ncbi:MAG: hypothetical protein E3J72_22515 [Planctomycetota bacterium]|nr:MAG: hypothetical protein E3J72_22515 [Planctomycetota bacterium]
MFFYRCAVVLIVAGILAMLCGCASHRPRAMRDSGSYSAPVAVPAGGSAHVKGGLAHSQVHHHGHGDECWDIFVMFILFTWLFHH